MGFCYYNLDLLDNVQLIYNYFIQNVPGKPGYSNIHILLAVFPALPGDSTDFIGRIIKAQL